jgi:gluconolactonase
MSWQTILIAVPAAIAVAAATPAVEDLRAPGETVRKLAGGLSFAEGPTADAAGNVFFTDQPNDRILEWSVEGNLSSFLQPAGRSNGMSFARDGSLIACADEKNELWSISADGEVTVIWRDHGGQKLNGPNDVWIHPSGSLYFTDPYYQRSWWSHKTPPQDGQHVYRLSADRKSLTRVTRDLEQPNGIVGTPDGKVLYVADIQAGRTYAYDIQPDGSLTGKRLHCSLGSDGMTLDEEGHLYLTGKGVHVFDKTGKEIQAFDVPEDWTGNVAFGGADHKTLFITASKGLYAVRLRVKGANAAK